MDLPSLKQAYEIDGFVVVQNFLPPAELRELAENLARYIREIVPTLPASDAFYEDRSRPETLKQLHRMEQDPFFAQYRANPRWVAAAEGLLGEPAQVHGAEWFNKPPATDHVTPPHQDNFYFCLTPPQVLTMWLALDPVDDENGCLRYVRGSHLAGIRPHSRTKTLGFSQGISDYGPADRAGETAIHLSPGDLAIHHGNTIHRADANRSPTRHRRSFAMVFQGQSCRRDEAAFARYSQAAQAQHAELGLTK
jgi:phytanoyl-CoA hydroxylase